MSPVPNEPTHAWCRVALAMRIDLFRMERMQSLHWHRVEYDLSESGVLRQRL